MQCPQCRSTVPDGTPVCPSCQHLLGTTPSVATGALTPPDGLVPHTPTSAETDQLAIRLQAAIGEAYAVEGTLGAGGFAVVYLVRDLHLKRKLAVKVLSPDLITSRTVLERFRREAETVAQLSHPHIVPLHFIGQKDDLLYLAMECIEGGSLNERIEREGKLSVDEAVRVLREVASALAYAHRRGVIHRDIKPQNVLLEAETGRSLVTDFGIARTEQGTSLTASGMLVGTPAYLSPEQITGQPSDHRADIYALGVMAYEMLTGQPPFSGPTPTAVLMKRIASPPTPIVKLRPEVPEPIRDIVEACLAQDPAERFQSAGDIVSALGGATPVSGGHATAEIRVRKRRERKKLLVGLGAGGGLLAAGIAAAVLLSSGGPAPPALPPVDSGMAIIPSGPYTIGTDDRDPRLVHARPAHVVTLDSFGIDRTEVTIGAYAGYVATGRAPAPWAAVTDSALPVTGVLYAEAANYCAWKHEGGRLPSEVEWEAAARGRDARLYPWGNAWDQGRVNTASGRMGRVVPVGGFGDGRTPEGVGDLIGNVWEWTSTPAAPYPGSSAPPPAAGLYVIRGGAYNSYDNIATAVFRGLASPAAGRGDLAATGFRCVMLVRGRPASR